MEQIDYCKMLTSILTVMIENTKDGTIPLGEYSDSDFDIKEYFPELAHLSDEAHVELMHLVYASESLLWWTLMLASKMSETKPMSFFVQKLALYVLKNE